MLTSDHIKQLCATVRHFSRLANWNWQAMPVIMYEFASMRAFHEARADILEATKNMHLDSRNIATRIISSEIEEIDCNGITFRLVCRERVMTTNGPYGAAELKRQ